MKGKCGSKSCGEANTHLQSLGKRGHSSRLQMHREARRSKVWRGEVHTGGRCVRDAPLGTNRHHDLSAGYASSNVDSSPPIRQWWAP